MATKKPRMQTTTPNKTAQYTLLAQSPAGSASRGVTTSFIVCKQNSRFKLGGDSEHLYTDLPVIKSGGYRLSTYDNYAYHLGNQIEPWMNEVYNSVHEVPKKENTYSKFAVLRRNRLEYLFSEYLFITFINLS